MECAICTLPYDTAHAPIMLECRHVLGAECLETWLNTDTGHNTCPCCRAVLFTPEPPHSEWEGRIPPELDEEDLDAPWLFPPAEHGGPWMVGTSQGPVAPWYLRPAVEEDAVIEGDLDEDAVFEGDLDEEFRLRLMWDAVEWFTQGRHEEDEDDESEDDEDEEDEDEDENEVVVEVEEVASAPQDVERLCQEDLALPWYAGLSLEEHFAEMHRRFPTRQ
jgi:hypothetical protein